VRAVELAVEPLDRLGDLAGGEQGALLAVEELREHPAGEAEAVGLLVALGELAVRRDVGEGDQGLGEQVAVGVVGVDVDRPVEVGGGVPLADLGGLVEAAQLVLIALVGPVEVDVVVGRHVAGGLLAAVHDEAADRRAEQVEGDLDVAGAQDLLQHLRGGVGAGALEDCFRLPWRYSFGSKNRTRARVQA
jgi:hypothetical protein